MILDQGLDRDRPGEPERNDDRSRWARGAEQLIWVVSALAAVGAGRVLRDPFVFLARLLSGGAGPGMAVAGWLIAVAPLATLGLILARGGRMRRWRRAMLFVVPAVLAGMLFWFVPIESTYIAGVVSGAGGAGLITGLEWGLGTAALGALVTPFALALSTSESRSQTIGALLTVGGLGSLLIAVVRAW